MLCGKWNLRCSDPSRLSLLYSLLRMSDELECTESPSLRPLKIVGGLLRLTWEDLESIQLPGFQRSQ